MLMEMAGIDGLPALADLTGISYRVLKNLPEAKDGGKLTTWSKLADFFDGKVRAILGVSRVTIDYLLGGDPPEGEVLAPEIPIKGTAGASLTYTGESIDLGSKSLECCFLVQVVDSSMEPVVRSGEMVIATGCEDPVSGDVVVFGSDSEGHWLVKQWIKTTKGHQFRSLNMREPLETIVMKKKPRMYRVIGVIMGKRT